jgi:nicotinate phosphoribosyltransferase
MIAEAEAAGADWRLLYGGRERASMAFLDELAGLRFTGEILAMPEGTIAFPNEPILRVTAPFCEALLLSNQPERSTPTCRHQAARVVMPRGRPVAEFAWRAQEPDRYPLASRRRTSPFWPPLITIAAAVMIHTRWFNSLTAGRLPAVAATYNRYTRCSTPRHPAAIGTPSRLPGGADNSALLAAVRLDSGDLVADSRYVRGVLDDAGLTETRILASGDLDEFRILDLLEAGAPIDGFGAG